MLAGPLKTVSRVASGLVWPRAQVETLSRGDMVSHFMNIGPRPGETWFDQGTGDARTLAHQACRFPRSRFIGTDFEDLTRQNDLARWLGREAPQNLVYGLLHFNNFSVQHPFVLMRMFSGGWPKNVAMDDEAARLVEKQWGSRFASVVSLFYPHTASSILFMKVDAALAVLRDGGTGIMVIDNRTDAERTIAHLRRHKRVKQVQWSPETLDRQDLASLGIEPYQTTHCDFIRGLVRVTLDHPFLIIFSA